MNTANTLGEIDVECALYIKSGDEYLPVVAPADRDVETALRAADPYRRVMTAYDLETSSRLLHEHVVAAYYDFEYRGYQLNLAADEDSRWDPILKDWRKILLGAARVYPLTNADNAATPLWLNVWTRGSRSEPAGDNASTSASS